MKSFLLKLLFTCFISTSLMSQEWNTIVTFTPSQSIKDIRWVNETTAYAVGALYNGTALNVKKTSDGGVTWEEQYAGNTSMNYYEIASPNNGDDVFIVGNYATLIHTNDGGTNWANLDVGTTEHFRDIFFLSNTIGYICGDGATILKTTDGGMTWVNLNAVMTGVNTIGKICFLNEDRGFIGGFNFGQETFDGGLTWDYIPGFEPVAGELFQIQDIQFLDENVGYMSGDLGLLYKTEDGGETWIDKQVVIPDYVTESLFSFKFLESNPNIGFACGYSGLLIRTYDAGDSWELMSSDIAGTNTPGGPIFHSLDFYGNKGLMTGNSGKLLSYEYSSVSITETSLNTNPISLYPNPVVDIINFSGFDAIIDEVQLIDLSGKVIKRIIKPTKHQIRCSGLNPGTYVFKIISRERIETKLFIKK